MAWFGLSLPLGRQFSSFSRESIVRCASFGAARAASASALDSSSSVISYHRPARPASALHCCEARAPLCASPGPG
jgi:hypothetical protein